MALIMSAFYNDVDTRLFTRGYQVAEAVSDKPQQKPVKVTGKCCARCVHRNGDKMDYCVRHNHDEKCYRFKLAKGLFLKKMTMITLARKRNKREYPVDGVFNIGRGAYQVREADGRYYSKFDSSGIPEYGCQSCCFRMNRNNGACAMLACRADERVDGKEVVFQKI